jgi:hypothetical protein
MSHWRLAPNDYSECSYAYCDPHRHQVKYSHILQVTTEDQGQQRWEVTMNEHM